MDVLPKFVDMAMDTEEKKEESPVAMDSPSPVYPYGLCISMSEKELEKLDLDGDVEVGDMLHMHCLVKCTSVSKRDTDQGTCMRVELQITAIAAESEDDENEQAEEATASRKPVSYKKMYEGY